MNYNPLKIIFAYRTALIFEREILAPQYLPDLMKSGELIRKGSALQGREVIKDYNSTMVEKIS